MKRKLLNLGLLSFASILAIAGCSGVAGVERTSGAPTHVVDEDVKPEYALPEYDDDELPVEGKTYDLTGDFDFSTDDAARGEELLNTIRYIAGPSITNVFQELFGNLFDWFVKSNYFTVDEINSIANVIQKYARERIENPKDFIIELAATVNVEKLCATLQNIKRTPEAWTDLKRAILSMEEEFRDPLTYRKVDKFFEGQAPEIHALAEQEAKVWDNFKIKGDDLSIVDSLGELIDNDNIIVTLRFVNHISKSLVKDLNQYELGFMLKNMFNISSGEQFDAVCLRYVMNNKLKCINDIGKVMKNLNLTDTTWQAVLNGVRDYAKMQMFVLSKRQSAYVAIDDKPYVLYVDKFAEVYDAVNPNGFRVLVNFMGLIINNIDQDIIDDVESHVDDPSQIDLVKLEDLYNKCYGLLTAEDKEYLNDQMELFGIDFAKFNTDLDDLPEEQKSQLGPVMDLLNLNIIGPITQYYAQVGNIEDPYTDEREADFSTPDYNDYGFQLIFKKGTEITAKDLERYLKDDNFSTTRVNLNRDYYSGHGAQDYDDDDPKERENFEFAPSVEEGALVDTSEEGEGYFTATFTAHYHFKDVYVSDEDQDLPAVERAKENLEKTYTLRMRVYYYVIAEDVDVYFDDFSSSLGELRQGSWYSSRDYIIDSNDNKASYSDINGATTLEKGGDYTADNGVVAHANNAHFYSSEEKRFIELDEEYSKYRAEEILISLDKFDTTELGLHYRLATLKIIKRGETPEEVESYPVPVPYYVVDELDFEVLDHYFDPGFGI